jgi:IclR family transcriptional regulator, mhp operon transcriptional activator
MPHYQPVRALERGLAVLKATNSLKKVTVEAIATETGLSWSTALRMLETLECNGYVRRNDDDRVFHATLMARALSKGSGRGSWVAELASASISKLSRQLVWPIDLMIFDNDAMLIVETTHRSSPLSIDRNMVGRRLPVLLTSAGRAYLAHTSAVERRA